MLKLSALNSLIGMGTGFIIPLLPLWLLNRFDVPDTYSGPMIVLASLTMGFAPIASTGLAHEFGTIPAIVLCQVTSTAFMLPWPSLSTP
jgi:hypothetical protein